ncbi:unnamed protein product [Arabis nemorensis]|uniref:Uncharacterized protein n=1 Tax=Arabis nemorensis TaxID=586526 RepID=A0A565AY23_9BRAS|nr:unnamed protein product [Arabis nemorensis]
MKIDSVSGGDQRLRSNRSSPSKYDGATTPFRYNRNRRLETESWRSSENEEGIEEFREKIMSDLKTVADKMTESIFRVTEEEEEKRKDELESKRRAAPITETERNLYNGLGIVEEKRVNFSILGYESTNSNRSREKKEVTKFVSTLTKKEIEDDYVEMTGHRPPRRPKKRPRTIQKQVDMLYPAVYFTEINQDIYKVPEAAENVKR